jgi:hypothetical protein
MMLESPLTVDITFTVALHLYQFEKKY